jgi:hypothetical protein
MDKKLLATAAIAHKMKIKLLIIFLLNFNLAYSQVKDTLIVSALILGNRK